MPSIQLEHVKKHLWLIVHGCPLTSDS
jgi:hypothetical protein